VATGDSEQLKPVSQITNHNIDYDAYIDSVMSQVFNHEIRYKHYNIVQTTEDSYNI
jgi:hypothetical protein